MTEGARVSDARGGSVVLDLYVEVATGGACMGHIPALPGFCFRSENTEEIPHRAPDRLAEYVKWLAGRGLVDLTTATRDLAVVFSATGVDAVDLRERERLAGAPVWESGNAAVLFSVDRRLLADEDVRAHLRFVAEVLAHVRSLVEPLTAEQRAHRPRSGRRSIDETLEHIGNCIWWYTSRINDALPEPPEIEREDPLDRIERLVAVASDDLLSIPSSERNRVHTPKRFLTRDPHEQWTYGKVCRREAEHVWAHLPGILRDLEVARSAGD